MSAVIEPLVVATTQTKTTWSVPDDKRVFLKIKLAALVAESHIIRSRANKARGDLRYELNAHRTDAVRKAARSTGLALGLIRGKTIEQMEPTCKPQHEGGAGEPNWVEIGRMLKRYGGLWGAKMADTAPYNGKR